MGESKEKFITACGYENPLEKLSVSRFTGLMPPKKPQHPRNYCFLLDPHKYNRNHGCQLHDNAYGINGGGSERDRWSSDFKFYKNMRHQGDPVALLALLGCLSFGWFFFNYHPGRWLWRGQLVRRFVKAPD